MPPNEETLFYKGSFPSEKKPLELSGVICYHRDYRDLLTIFFPVSGVTTWDFSPASRRFRCFHQHLPGRGLGSLHPAPLSDELRGFYRPRDDFHELHFQHRGHPHRRIPVFQGRPYGLASYPGGHRGHPSRRLYRIVCQSSFPPRTRCL